MADDAMDQPPALATLIDQHGKKAGMMLGEFGQSIGLHMDSTINAAFRHGVVEGMEVSAKAVNAYADKLAELVPDAPSVVRYIRELRDLIRVKALEVEIPT